MLEERIIGRLQSVKDHKNGNGVTIFVLSKPLKKGANGHAHFIEAYGRYADRLRKEPLQALIQVKGVTRTDTWKDQNGNTHYKESTTLRTFFNCESKEVRENRTQNSQNAPTSNNQYQNYQTNN